MSESHNEYPKFNPEIHLILDPNNNNNNNNKTKQFDIDKLNIFSPECKSYIEPLSNNCFPIFTIDCIKIIQWELNNYLKNKDKCTNLKKFDKDIDFSFINFESPIFKNCKKCLPFLYDAFTNNLTINLLSNNLGFQIDLINDYEIIHFAKKIDDNNKQIIEKMNLGESSKIIIREKSVAYPYICLIKINKNDISENLPIGYGLFLKGRLIENLAGKIIYNKNTQNEMVLCPSFVPKQIKLYEDFKQNQILKKSNNNNNSKKIIHLSDDCNEDFKSIEKYKVWLNKYYNKGNI